jgi:hypothetical protein
MSDLFHFVRYGDEGLAVSPACADWRHNLAWTTVPAVVSCPACVQLLKTAEWHERPASPLTTWQTGPTTVAAPVGEPPVSAHTGVPGASAAELSRGRFRRPRRFEAEEAAGRRAGLVTTPPGAALVASARPLSSHGPAGLEARTVPTPPVPPLEEGTRWPNEAAVSIF